MMCISNSKAMEVTGNNEYQCHHQENFNNKFQCIPYHMSNALSSSCSPGLGQILHVHQALHLPREAVQLHKDTKVSDSSH